MLCDESLLKQYGATLRHYKKNATIFSEGSNANYYYQIVKGTVELINYHEDGKEFLQNIFSDGQSIGEALLFTDRPYPMSAVAKTDCTILQLSKSKFFDLLNDHSEVSLKLIEWLSDRMYYKYLMLFSLSGSNPEIKLKNLFDYLKSYHNDKEQYSFRIPLTRQQLANLTGLRVETVIRAIKRMEKDKLVKIENRKIFY